VAFIVLFFIEISDSVEQLEGALLRLVARLEQVLERLLARRRRLAAYNASVFILLEVRARQSTLCVVRCAVPDHCAGTNSGHLCTTRHVVVVVALILTRAVSHLGSIEYRDFFTYGGRV